MLGIAELAPEILATLFSLSHFVARRMPGDLERFLDSSVAGMPYKDRPRFADDLSVVLAVREQKMSCCVPGLVIVTSLTAFGAVNPQRPWILGLIAISALMLAVQWLLIQQLDGANYRKVQAANVGISLLLIMIGASVKLYT